MGLITELELRNVWLVFKTSIFVLSYILVTKVKYNSSPERGGVESGGVSPHHALVM